MSKWLILYIHKVIEYIEFYLINFYVNSSNYFYLDIRKKEKKTDLYNLSSKRIILITYYIVIWKRKIV